MPAHTPRVLFQLIEASAAGHALQLASITTEAAAPAGRGRRWRALRLDLSGAGPQCVAVRLQRAILVTQHCRNSVKGMHHRDQLLSLHRAGECRRARVLSEIAHPLGLRAVPSRRDARRPQASRPLRQGGRGVYRDWMAVAALRAEQAAMAAAPRLMAAVAARRNSGDIAVSRPTLGLRVKPRRRRRCRRGPWCRARRRAGWALFRDLVARWRPSLRSPPA